MAAMLPRIDAEEHLAAIDARAVAFGSLDARDAGAILRSLGDAARGRRERLKASPAALEAMGVSVVVQEGADGR